jgi:hypothetical protein
MNAEQRSSCYEKRAENSRDRRSHHSAGGHCAALLVNVNSFRPKLESELPTALGREVKVGNLSVCIWSCADNLSIADDPAFGKDPFIRAQALKVGVEVMPLIFSKTLHVTGLARRTNIANNRVARGRRAYAVGFQNSHFGTTQILRTPVGHLHGRKSRDLQGHCRVDAARKCLKLKR